MTGSWVTSCGGSTGIASLEGSWPGTSVEFILTFVREGRAFKLEAVELEPAVSSILGALLWPYESLATAWSRLRLGIEFASPAHKRIRNNEAKRLSNKIPRIIRALTVGIPSDGGGTNSDWFFFSKPRTFRSLSLRLSLDMLLGISGLQMNPFLDFRHNHRR